jgi:hypothetical protein
MASLPVKNRSSDSPLLPENPISAARLAAFARDKGGAPVAIHSDADRMFKLKLLAIIECV